MAACQLHILQRKLRESDLRKALTELPETLDETYERILLDIPRSEWPYVRTALLWICAHQSLPFKMGIPANILASATFSPHNLCDDPISESHTYDFDTLYELCGCLIRSSWYHLSFEDDGGGGRIDVDILEVNLAHYTVKEFLYSDRIGQSRISHFSMTDRTTTHGFLSAVFSVCSRTDLDKPPGFFYTTLEDYCREIGLLAPKYWITILIENEELWNN